ncbi:hypothetical protein [uncultured Tateyamaria sp.]|uniref:hypothetical protein n=1 Tax=uncultured Tateyamaria sp. TaxID=455651 RepID=UPI002605E986|nr:hypothetical protein [uncultured Tateyamaria sp.]
MKINESDALGLFLRLKSPALRNGHGFLLQTEYQPDESARSAFALERIEWRVGHTNSAIGPQEYHFLDIPSSHIHKFDINYLEGEDRMRQRNLPLAVPLDPDPGTLEDFLECAEKLLRIKGVSGIERPGFQGRLVS